MKIRTTPLLWLFVLLLTGACTTEKKLAPPMSIEALQNHVKFLASEDLAGRGTGSEGNRKAAEYIAEYFEASGLQPIENSYYQEFTVTTGVMAGQNTNAKIRSGDTKHQLKTGEDFTPLSQSLTGAVSGPLVFAGYGISAPDKNFDDYQKIDVSDKVVIVLRETPDAENPHGDFAEFGRDSDKIRIAREKGAAAIILVNAAHQDDELMSLTVTYPQEYEKIAVFSVTRAAIAPFFPENRALKDMEYAIGETKKSVSFALPNAGFEAMVELSFEQATSANVIGLVPGTDAALKDQYVVVGGHYDHLGMGGHGSRSDDDLPQIHFGADDNASGSAGVMAIAAQTAANPLPRPAIFMAFSGEELGLLGSTYFCDHPLVPLENIVAMINMDMIGRMTEQKVTISGTGTATIFDQLVDSIASKMNLTVSKSADGFGPSDHSAFYGRNIPVLAFFSGLHDDYHRPTDTWDKINFEGLRTLALSAGAVLDSLASAPIAPEFVKVKSSENSGRQMRFRVWVGTIPDYSDHPLGMRITGVRDDSPAARAGMTGGDIIVRFGEDTVKTIYDYTYALGKFKPGDEVPVEILRGEDQRSMTLKVVLEKRQ